MRTTRNIYQVLVEKLTAMLISRPWHRWESNIKMDLNELGLDSVNGFF